MDFLKDMHSFCHSFAGGLKDKLINERMNAPRGKKDRKNRDYTAYATPIILLAKYVPSSCLGQVAPTLLHEAIAFEWYGII